MTEIINQLTQVIRALSNVETCGKQNLLNLGGSIDILENVVRALSAPPETASAEDAEEEKK